MEQQLNKKMIDDYFSKNYDSITKIATNCAKKIKEVDKASQLVSDSYMHALSIDYSIKNEKILESIVVNFINKQVTWTGTKFKKNYVDNSTADKLLNKNLMAEDDNPYSCDELNKAMDNFFAHFESLKNALPVEKRILFKLIYEEDINTSGKLFKRLNGMINRTYCWSMIKEIKDYVKNNPQLNEHYYSTIKPILYNYSGC